MDWKLTSVVRETDHRFLNFFTFHYEVSRDGKSVDYPYFVASRHSDDALLARTKDYSRPDGVLICAIREENEPELLIIEEFRPPLNRIVIGLPAGLLDPTDKDIAEAAAREAIEETGVYLKDVRLICPPSPTSSGLSDETVAIVEGRVSGLTETHLERFEDIRGRFIPIRELPAFLASRDNFIAINARLCMMMLAERYRV